ncbi:MAG: hypothetical protein K9N62_05900 [Verrucomicrobia bacterium]|nr:hypothetical protein [Verrucomicrobiota bacterium]
MKLIAIITTTVLVLANAHRSQSAEPGPRQYVVALAPILDRETGATIFKECLELVLNEASAGDQVEFIDARRLERLAVVSIPNGSARTRANSREFAGKFSALKSHLTESSISNADERDQLMIPILIDDVARSRDQSIPLTLILSGSPLFVAQSATERAFNMTDGLVPGDGMIGASVNLSLFGTKERKHQLDGARVYWFAPNENWASSAMHQRAVERFWTLFFGEQGAILNTLGSDVQTVFDRAIRGDARPLVAATLDMNDNGMSMQTVSAFRRQAAAPPSPIALTTSARPAHLIPAAPKPSPSTNTIARTTAIRAHSTSVHAAGIDSIPAAIAPTSPEHEIPESRAHFPIHQGTTPQTTPPESVTSPIEIGILWDGLDGTRDLDIYVLPYPGAAELSFKRPISRDGKHVRDWRQPNSLTDFESVRLNSGAQISKVEAWVNLFKGSGPVTGKVQVIYQDTVFTGTFTIPAAYGNAGINPLSRRTDPHWTRLDLQKIVSQNP